MKKLIYVLLLFTVFTACKEDLGSYEYTDINMLTIENIQETYLVSSGASPEIYPELEFTKDIHYKEDDYEFEWVSFKAGSLPGDKRSTVHKGKNFDVAFPLGIGTYEMFYVVKEKATGMSWRHKFSIRVEGTYRGGWAILYAAGDNAQVDYFEYNHANGDYPKSYRNFTKLFADGSTGKGFSLRGEPKFIQGWSVRNPSTGAASKYQLYMGADNTEKINITDGFVWDERYAFIFETAGGSAMTSIEKLYPVSAGSGFAYSNGNAFLTYNVFQYNFGTPINRLANGETFPIAPYIAINRVSSSSFIGLMYDTKNKRFVRSTGGGQTSTTPLAYNPASAAFDPNDVGMDLVWMGATNFSGGWAYAVLTKDNRYYLARMQNASAFVAQYLDEITDIPQIAQATAFAVDQLYGYMQYAVGGKLYQYDAGETKQAYLMKDFGSRQISMLKYDQGVVVPLSAAQNANNVATFGKRFLPALTALICATYDPANPSASGHVDFFETPQFNGAYETYYSFDGMGKVKDVCNVETPYGW